MGFLDDKLAELQDTGYQAPDLKYGLVIYNLKSTYAVSLWKWTKAVGIRFSLRPDFLWCHMIEDRFNKGRKPKKIPDRPLLCDISGVGLLDGELASKDKYLKRPRLVAYLGGNMLENRRLRLETMGFRVNENTPSPYIVLKLDPDDADIENAVSNQVSLKETIPNILIQGEMWRKWR